MAPVIIRPESPTDFPAIRHIVERSFAAIPYSDHREQLMVDRLRECAAYLPYLSLVAEREGELVGYVMLTRAEIAGDQNTTNTLALAPLSVLPDAQRQGIGGRLLRTAHAEATARGFGSIILVGIADYYPRFGYERLSAYPITVPFDVADENAMVLRLRPNGLDGVAGQVRYAPPFFDH